MPDSLPHRVKNLFDGAITAALRLPAASASVDDIDGRLDLTGPLSIVAPRRFGESDLAVFPLAIGTSRLASLDDEDAAWRVLDRHRALGGTMIDTSDEGAGSAGQAIVGRWLRARSAGQDAVVTARIGRGPDAPGLGSVSVVRAVEAALGRLGVERIDVLYLDGEDEEIPLADSLATVEWLIEAGKVGWVGAANVSAERLMEARVLVSTGLPKFVAVQNPYSLMARQPFESGLRIVAAGQSLAVSPTAPLAGGFLTGRVRSRSDAATIGSPWAAEHLGRKGTRVRSALEAVAREHDTTTTSAALAWLLAKRNVSAPVVTVTTPKHVDSLMVASSIRLTRAQMLDLDHASE